MNGQAANRTYFFTTPLAVLPCVSPVGERGGLEGTGQE